MWVGGGGEVVGGGYCGILVGERGMVGVVVMVGFIERGK